MNKYDKVVKVEQYYDEQYLKNTEIVGNIVVPIIIFIFIAPFILAPICALLLYFGN